jgi:hypothetical protein
MYLNNKSNNYEEKYKKYKNKYQKFKNQISGANCVINEYVSLPNPEEDDIISGNNLLDLCPEERITIKNKCYEVKSLYKWIITNNNNRLPGIEMKITPIEKKELIQAYKKLQTLIPSILTREKLIQIYPNLKKEKIINLYNRDYTYISLGTFVKNTFGSDNNLSNLERCVF